jgi:hypothetical protein
MRLTTVETKFSYSSFNEPTPEAYETLLLDVMRGDATLFMRGDQVERAWHVVMPILDYWRQQDRRSPPTRPVPGDRKRRRRCWRATGTSGSSQSRCRVGAGSLQRGGAETRSPRRT